MDRFGLVLVVHCNERVYCFKKKNEYMFPILWVDSLFDLNSVSYKITRYLEKKGIKAYYLKGVSNVLETKMGNMFISYKFIECQIDNEFSTDESELFVPKYFLNKRYFNSISKIYIKYFNDKNPVEDIPLSARALFSEYFFETNMDYYAEISKYTKNILAKKGINGIYNENDAAKFYLKRCNDSFVNKYQHIIEDAIKINYAYYDTKLVE